MPKEENTLAGSVAIMLVYRSLQKNPSVRTTAVVTMKACRKQYKAILLSKEASYKKLKVIIVVAPQADKVLLYVIMDVYFKK
jgi:hypothetical protein